MTIEHALMQKLLNDTAVTALVGDQVYYRRAPESVVMPWIVITNSGGMRDKISRLSEQLTCPGTKIYDVITVYVESMDQFLGRDICDACMGSLENFRGDMFGLSVRNLKAGTPRDLDGYSGSFRYLLTFYCWYEIITPIATPIVP